MQSVQAAIALEGCGLEGDRYCAGTGHWSRFGRVCEVTFIATEDLDDIELETGLCEERPDRRYRFEGPGYQRILVPIFSTELGPEQAGDRSLYTVANLYTATEASPGGAAF